jgi:predicted glycosyltransferase
VPPTAEEVARSRRELGYGEADVLCIVAVGGSGVGEPLLRRVLDAVPIARARLPELRFLMVTGPRIDPVVLPRVEGADVRGYVPDLYLRMAAADVAVVQGGLSTTMELTTARVPFLYVPLQHHFEQNFHVRHRLEQYRAGQCASYAEIGDPDWLAETLVKLVDTDVAFRPVETGGAERAAAMLAELI